MPQVAFATSQQAPEINDDERPVVDELHRRGVTVVAAIWDSPAVDWSQFDCVVIRSAWDYHLKAAEYEKWLQNFPADCNRLWNPASVVRENINKKYLTALAARGYSVVPTAIQPAGEEIQLAELLRRHGWQEVVIKPAVSASAHGTWRASLNTAEADQFKFASQVRTQEMLIQPYAPEVATHGEWSLVFFDGSYSHAVLKRPADGDFRVQREYGGNAVTAEPSPRLIEQAQAILSAFDQSLLYARIDGFERSGNFVLMELEINEPFLVSRLVP